MSRPFARNFVILMGLVLLLWLFIEYLLPIALPFLLGSLLAFAAEPGVALINKRLKLPRWLSSAVSVSVTLLLTLTLLVLLGSLAIRELSTLTQALPNLWQTAEQGLQRLQDLLFQLISGTPERIRPTLEQSVMNLFGNQTAMMSRLVSKLPSVASRLLYRFPDGALTIGTALISSYMISARLPKIKRYVQVHLPEPLRNHYLPALGRIKTAVFGWLKAQLKLSAVCFCILTVGFLILRIPYAPVWALLISLVDALPLLGTGAVLLPWALICFLQTNYLLCLGLIGLYAAAALSRTVLEPRLVGKQLGLDPLVTLAALYVGYRFWGILGMLLAPLLAVIVGEFAANSSIQRKKSQ